MAPDWWGELKRRPALIGAIIVVALAAIGVVGPQVRSWLPRPAPRPSPAARAILISPGFADVAVPVPSPTPVPLPDLGAPPAGIPLIWISTQGEMVAYTWGGKAVGTLHGNFAAVSPDGQVLWNGDDFTDPRGHVLGRLGPTEQRFTWASGSDGVCRLVNAGGGSELSTYRLGASQPVSVRALPSRFGSVAACSFQRDLALVTAADSYVTDLYWIRLHDGALLGHRSFAPDAVGYVTVSPDMRYFAENYVGGPHPGNQTEVTAIRRVSDSSLVASRADLVLGFSADDSEVVTGAFNEGTVGVFGVAGRKLWAPTDGADWARAAPFGAEFAMTAGGAVGQPAVLQLVLDGTALPPISVPDGAHLVL